MSPSDPAAFDRQYAALRSGCGVVELSDWSSVTLTGGDRHAFLHNFCTNDVKRLAPGASCEAFFTNVKGKIVGHGLVTCRSESLVIVGPPGQGEALAAHLDRYVIREDVAVRDTTAERSYTLLAGGGPARALAEIPKLGTTAATPADSTIRFIEWDLLGSAFCGLIESAANDSAVRQRLSGRNAVLCSQAAFHAVRIEAGTPLFGIDFDESNLPQEVARNEKAISFTKGCYLGQETVARIDALGHVNQRLTGVQFAGADVPENGTELTREGKAAGQVTSATFSPRLDAPLALAMVRREHNAVGSRLESKSGPCEVVALPL